MPQTNLLYVIEGDHNVVSPAVLASARAASDGMDTDEPVLEKTIGAPSNMSFCLAA
jgi:hypothetical protein